MADKMTKKELRAPDTFQRVGGEAREWLQARQRAVTLAIVVLLLGGVGIALGSYFSKRGEEHAATDLGLALRPLQRPVEGSPEAAQALPGEEPFKTAQEKQAAVAAAMEAFRKEHRDSPAETTATLALGDAQLQQGHYDEALKAFEEYLKDAPATDLLRASAQEGVGYAYEGKKDLDKALEAFDQLARDTKGEFFQGMGQYHHARILALQGKKQEAAQAFADVQAKFPAAAAGRLAGDRLALLATEGVHPAAQAVGAPDAGR